MKGANKFPEYSHMDESRFSRFGFIDPCSRPSQVVDKEEDLKTVIFAPDPVTGIPSSDIGYIMSQDANPQVAQFVRDNLMRSVPESVRCQDADTALELTPRDGESLGQFADRLKSGIADLVKKAQSSKDS